MNCYNSQLKYVYFSKEFLSSDDKPEFKIIESQNYKAIQLYYIFEHPDLISLEDCEWTPAQIILEYIYYKHSMDIPEHLMKMFILQTHQDIRTFCQFDKYFRAYFFELYLFINNKLPGPEYFDPDFNYYCFDNFTVSYFNKHKDDFIQLRQYVNTQSIYNLLIQCQNISFLEGEEEYHKFINMIAYIYYKKGQDIPEKYKFEGWQDYKDAFKYYNSLELQCKETMEKKNFNYPPIYQAVCAKHPEFIEKDNLTLCPRRVFNGQCLFHLYIKTTKSYEIPEYLRQGRWYQAALVQKLKVMKKDVKSVPESYKEEGFQWLKNGNSLFYELYGNKYYQLSSLFINDLLSNYLIDIDGTCLNCGTEHVPIYNVENLNDKNRNMYQYCEKCIKYYYKRRYHNSSIDIEQFYQTQRNIE